MLCRPPSRVNGIGDVIFVPQLWGMNNIRINVTYDRVVPDAEHNVVVVDLLETVVRDRPSLLHTARNRPLHIRKLLNLLSPPNCSVTNCN